MRTPSIFVLAALLWVGACDSHNVAPRSDAGSPPDDASSPPAQAPVLDAERISREVAGDVVRVVGSLGAISPGEAEVEVFGTSATQSFRGRADEDGAFSVVLPASMADTVRVRALLGDARSGFTYVFAAGRTASEDDEPACEERAELAAGHLTVVAGTAVRTCSTDDDCAQPVLMTLCGTVCATQALSQSEIERVDANIEVLNRGLCEPFERQDCTASEPACGALAATQARCLQQRCELFDVSRSTARVRVVDQRTFTAHDMQEIWIADANGAPVMLGSWLRAVGDYYDIPLNEDGRLEFVLRKLAIHGSEPIAHAPGWQNNERSGDKIVAQGVAGGEQATVIVDSGPSGSIDVQVLNESALSFTEPEVHLHFSNSISGVEQIAAFGVAEKLCIANEELSVEQSWPLIADPAEEPMSDGSSAFTLRFFADDDCATELSADQELVLGPRTVFANPGDHLIVLLSWELYEMTPVYVGNSVIKVDRE